MSTTNHAACIPPPLEPTDQEFACTRSLSSTPLITMVGNEVTNEELTDAHEEEVTECPIQMPPPVTVCIPKVEPYFNSLSDSNEDLLNTDELIGSPIPFITPYKIKDPIILLEKCDKIWETLKLIKDVQGTKNTDTKSSVSLVNANCKQYIKYQPNVLGNTNGTLPNLKLRVKSTQRLYPCSTCGKLYLHKRDLRIHSAKIHGIIMSFDRVPKNCLPGKQSVPKDKETSVAETEQSNVKKLNLKRSHSKQIKDPLSKSVKPVDSNESNPESGSKSQSQGKKGNISTLAKDTLINGGSKSQSQGKKGNISTLAKETLINGENVQKEQRKVISRKEINQNSTPPLPHQSSRSNTQCVLCKNFVTDLRQHLTDYHKIETTDFMLRELENTSTVLKANKSKNDIDNNNKQQFQRSGKRKLNVSHTRLEKRFKFESSTSDVRRLSETGDYHCYICSGIFKPHHVKRHLDRHRNRGETKENYHLINYDYLNASNMNGFEHRDRSNLFKNIRTSRRISKKRKEFYRLNDANGNSTCSCGRSFRNPYTLHVHKKNCKLQNDMEETVENLSQRINITIKKKNDSYEIVSRKAEEEKKLQDTAKDSEKDEQADKEIIESSKYSEEHKFLKIQRIDEDTDIDIDIEENSQSGSTINNNNNTDNLLTKEVINESEQQPSEPRTRKSRSSSRLSSNIKNALKNYIETHIIEKQNICVCGTLFDSREALEVHILKHQAHSQLTCGYCDATFPDIDAWKEHKCSHTNIKLFIDIPLEVDCRICNITLSSYIAFDEHVRQNHYDPVVTHLCFRCDKRFCNATVRANHIKSEHDKYVCPMCNIRYSEIMKHRHEGYHYGLGYPCHICKKTYSSKVNCNRHKHKTHSVRRLSNKVTSDSHPTS